MGAFVFIRSYSFSLAENYILMVCHATSQLGNFNSPIDGSEYSHREVNK